MDWSGVRYFERHEFGYCGDVEPDEQLVWMLDQARLEAREPFIITSGIRGPRHDGDKSAHITGHAVDIRCHTSKERMRIVQALLGAGFRRIGIYDRHIHADTDQKKPQGVIWVGISA